MIGFGHTRLTHPPRSGAGTFEALLASLRAALATRRERHRRDETAAILRGLQDRELSDLGISRSEIDYVASVSGWGLSRGTRGTVPAVRGARP